MDELESIAEQLRRQRRDLDELSIPRSGETAELLEKIDGLRRRAERTQRQFEEVSRRVSSKKK